MLQCCRGVNSNSSKAYGEIMFCNQWRQTLCHVIRPEITMLSNLRNTTKGYDNQGNTYNTERLEMSKRIGQILIAMSFCIIYDKNVENLCASATNNIVY